MGVLNAVGHLIPGRQCKPGRRRIIPVDGVNRLVDLADRDAVTGTCVVTHCEVDDVADLIIVPHGARDCGRIVKSIALGDLQPAGRRLDFVLVRDHGAEDHCTGRAARLCRRPERRNVLEIGFGRITAAQDSVRRPVGDHGRRHVEGDGLGLAHRPRLRRIKGVRVVRPQGERAADRSVLVADIQRRDEREIEILPVADDVLDHQVAEGVVIGNLEFQRVLQRRTRSARTLDHRDGLLNGKRLVLQRICRIIRVRFGGGGLGAVAVVDRVPLTLASRPVFRRHGLGAVQREDALAVGVMFGHVEVDQHDHILGAGSFDFANRGHQGFVGKREIGRAKRRRGDIGRPRRVRGGDIDCRDHDVVVEPVEDIQVGDRLVRRDADCQFVLADAVRARRGLVFGT